MEKQRTIQKPISISGVGLHTGQESSITLKPAGANTGYHFCRTDLKDKPMIQALAKNVNSTERGTVIQGKSEDAVIHTVEHLLAAVYSAGIDNILIESNGAEIPIMDGSSIAFVKALEEAGITEQKEEREYLEITEKFVFSKDNSEIIVFPSQDFRVDIHIAFDSDVLKNQFAQLTSLSDFKTRFADCRTFVFVRELRALLQNNLIKGGGLDNAVVIYDEILPDEEIKKLKALFKIDVDTSKKGFLNDSRPDCPNEQARHKLIDFIGDLALCGKFVKGHFIATKPGHKVNCEFAKQIQDISEKPIPPAYTCSTKTVLDVNKIKAMLPHRYPFLMIDKIIQLTKHSAIGIKNVTTNEPFFQGHFPSEPFMPGVLLIEACAQTAGMVVLHGVEDPENYSTYFLKMDNIKFRQKVVPGDTLILDVQLTSPVRRGIAEAKATVWVRKTIVTEVEFVAQVIKNKI